MAITKNIKQGEAKTFVFTVADSSGTVVDVSTATLTYTVKREKDSSVIIIQKDDSDFDKTDAATGIVKVTLSETDTDITDQLYYSELKVWFSPNSVEKSQDIFLIVEKAVY